MKIVFWDYGGTILDDCCISVQSINDLLENRRLKNITIEEYRELYGFPIIEFYEKIGFDFEVESFDKLTGSFFDLYNPRCSIASLREGAEKALIFFKSAGYKQVILSSVKTLVLKKQLRYYHILDYFDEIIALDKTYNETKLDKILKYYNIHKGEITESILIGDTIQDFEISKKITSKCYLVNGGHISKSRLLETGATVIDKFEEIYS